MAKAHQPFGLGELKRGTYTSQIMRLVARLLLNLRNIKPLSLTGDHEEHNFWSYLKPQHLDEVIKASLLTASPSNEDPDNLEKPSNALKLGYDIKRLLNGKIGLAIIAKDKESRQDAEDMLKAMQIYWGTKVTKLARVLLDQRHYNTTKSLPEPDDIKTLNVHLKKSLTVINFSDTSSENFKTVGELVSAKLVLYNRRRTGELQAIKLTDFDKRTVHSNSEILGQLSDFEKRLLDSQEVMTVRGKTGRGVPVILPAETKPGMNFLTSQSVREAAGIENKRPNGP